MIRIAAAFTLGMAWIAGAGSAAEEKPVTGASPDSAWAFGGIAALLTGRDFTAAPEVFFGGEAASVLAVDPQGAWIAVAVPPYPVPAGLDAITVDVVVREEGEDSILLAGFTYVQRAEEDGLLVNAFHFDASEGFDGAVELANGAMAGLAIPPPLAGPEGAGRIAGLFRSGNNRAALGTAAIPAGQTIAGVPEFDLHLYETMPGPLPQVPGDSLLREITDWRYDPEDEANRIRASIPLQNSALTLGFVRQGLTVWLGRNSLDPDTLAVGFELAPYIVYQTGLLAEAVQPPASDPLPSATQVTAIALAINGTGGVSLRRNALPPPDVAEAIVVDPAAASAPNSGGGVIRLLAPLGGLAWIDRIELRDRTGATLASILPGAFTTPPGLTGRALEAAAPGVSCSGPVTVAVFHRARPQVSLRVLPEGFTYLGDGAPCSPEAPAGCGTAGAGQAPPPSSGNAATLGLLSAALVLMAAARRRSAPQPEAKRTS